MTADPTANPSDATSSLSNQESVGTENAGTDVGLNSGGWWSRHREDVWFGGLVLYVILLAIGTVAELLNIRWILDLPIY